MIDYEKLRKDLVDYFGTAFTLNPMAMVDLLRVQNASDEELVDIAKRNGFDLTKYFKDKVYYK